MKQLVRQQGFLLVAVIWFLLIITLLVSFFVAQVDSVVQTAQTIQAQTQAQVEIHTTKATVLYLLATERFLTTGLNLPTAELNNTGQIVVNRADESMDEYGNISFTPTGRQLFFDDTAYRGSGQARFAIQDEGGLISLNHWAQNTYFRLFGLLGIPSESYGTLLDKLLDYTDLDNLARLNGAERDDYKKANLAEPSNRLLLTVLQTKQLIEWRNRSELWQTPRWLQNTTIASISYPNLNTAPALVLQAAYGLNTEAAERIVQGRKQFPIAWLQQAQELGGMPIMGVDEESLTIFPSTYLRLTFWHPALGDVQRLHLYLTPSQEPVPWRVEYAHRLPLKSLYEALPLTHVQTEFFPSPLPTH